MSREKTNIDLAGVLAMLDDSESDYDDSDVDPDYKESENNADCHTSSDESLERQRTIQEEQQLFPGEAPAEDDARDTGTRKRKSNPAAWKKNTRKQSLAMGKEYTDTQGRKKTCRFPQPSNCGNCKFHCSVNFTDADRSVICAEYWQLGDYCRQKDFLLSTVKVYDTQRQRPRGERKRRRRSKTLVYFFKKNGEEKRVCKKFFLKTLNIGHGPLDSALQNKGDAGAFVGEDKRGKHIPGNKTDDDTKARVKRHIESFPKIESHYTRSDTRRLYLNQTLSISKMYKLYKEECENANPPISPVKECTYRKIFCEDYNLSFFHPRKDQCSKCAKYKMLDGEDREDFQVEYDTHLRRKEEAQEAKQVDKMRAVQEENFTSATFDLQSVLQLPSSNTSLMYYSRKVCVYNLCVYSAEKPNNATCFCWSEIEGGRGSNEIGTCLYEWICQLPPAVQEVSLYSDTCGGQNRNQNVAAMFLYAVQSTPLAVITHNFLESGHSHMECDSMHSAIESSKKYVDTYTMLDWISIFRQARRKNPYKVVHFYHNNFYNFQSLAKQLMKNKRRDVDGNLVNWLLIKSLQYRKNEPGVILYRYDYAEEFKRIKVYGRGRPCLQADLAKVYSSRIPISEAKKKDLIKLCDQHVVPAEVQPWYQALPTSRLAKDHVPCPAAQDSGEDDDSDLI